MINEFGSRNRIDFELLIQKRPLVKIEPIITVDDYVKLNLKHNFTFKIFTHLCNISDQMIKKGLKPIVLGGFACTLLTGNFYREHADIDFGLVCNSNTPLHLFHKSFIDLFKSFGYIVENKQTFNNFYQFLLTDKDGFRFELDIYVLEESTLNYKYTPTQTSPFSKFKISKNLIAYSVDQGKYKLFVPRVPEVIKIKSNDSRPKGELDTMLLGKKQIQNIKEMLQDGHN